MHNSSLVALSGHKVGCYFAFYLLYINFIPKSIVLIENFSSFSLYLLLVFTSLPSISNTPLVILSPISFLIYCFLNPKSSVIIANKLSTFHTVWSYSYKSCHYKNVPFQVVDIYYFIHLPEREHFIMQQRTSKTQFWRSGNPHPICIYFVAIRSRSVH